MYSTKAIFYCPPPPPPPPPPSPSKEEEADDEEEEPTIYRKAKREERIYRKAPTNLYTEEARRRPVASSSDEEEEEEEPEAKPRRRPVRNWSSSEEEEKHPVQKMKRLTKKLKRPVVKSPTLEDVITLGRRGNRNRSHKERMEMAHKLSKQEVNTYYRVMKDVWNNEYELTDKEKKAFDPYQGEMRDFLHARTSLTKRKDILSKGPLFKCLNKLMTDLQSQD